MTLFSFLLTTAKRPALGRHRPELRAPHSGLLISLSVSPWSISRALLLSPKKCGFCSQHMGGTLTLVPWLLASICHVPTWAALIAHATQPDATWPCTDAVLSYLLPMHGPSSHTVSFLKMEMSSGSFFLFLPLSEPVFNKILAGQLTPTTTPTLLVWPGGSGIVPFVSLPIEYKALSRG